MGELIIHGRPLVKEVEGGVIVRAPCAARMTSHATIFVPQELFDKIVVYEHSFNARNPARIEGPAVSWKYSDGHGMSLVAILKRGEEFSLWVPGFHDHGPGTSFKGFVTESGEIVLKEIPSPRMKKLEI